MKIPFLFALASTLAFSPAQADWLHYRGPTQNGVSPEKGWNANVSAPLKVLWRVSVGRGTSSVTTSNGKAYTIGNADGRDTIYCFDATSGKVLWRVNYPLDPDPNMFEGGPRSTPTIDDSRVYSVSHQGDLWCLDAATGQKVWYKHYQQDFGGRRPDWGYAGSPLVHGDLLICDTGAANGSTVALHKATGEVAWKSGSDKAGYACPVVATLEGQPTVIMFKSEAVVGCSLADGKELWRTPWKTSYDVNAATPLVIGSDNLFVSSGYNTGCAMFKIQNGQPTLLWKNKNLRTHINSATALGDSAYGIDGDAGGGNLVCLNLKDGERRWQEKSVKGGSLIEAEGKLIIFTEQGDLVICEASPAGFHQLSRVKALDKRCWSQPTLDAGRLFLRNNEGELICVDLGAH